MRVTKTHIIRTAQTSNWTTQFLYVFVHHYVHRAVILALFALCSMLCAILLNSSLVKTVKSNTYIATFFACPQSSITIILVQTIVKYHTRLKLQIVPPFNYEPIGLQHSNSITSSPGRRPGRRPTPRYYLCRGRCVQRDTCTCGWPQMTIYQDLIFTLFVVRFLNSRTNKVTPSI